MLDSFINMVGNFVLGSLLNNNLCRHIAVVEWGVAYIDGETSAFLVSSSYV